MTKKLAILVVATVALGTGAAYAATLGVSSGHLWVGSQTLTKGTCTLTATTDTYVDENKPTNNFAASSTIATSPTTSKRQYAYVVFDLGTCAIPTTGGADTATLSLYMTTAPGSSRTLTATRVTSAWSGTTTWNTQPAVAGAGTTTFATGTTKNVLLTATVTIDADDFVKGTTNYGWRIADLGASAAATTAFASANAGSNRPTLVINYEK